MATAEPSALTMCATFGWNRAFRKATTVKPLSLPALVIDNTDSTSSKVSGSVTLDPSTKRTGPPDAARFVNAGAYFDRAPNLKKPN